MINLKFKLFMISALLFVFELNAQNTIRNFGDLKVHNSANINLSVNLINDGSFIADSGLVGFYGKDKLAISGAFNPYFNDLEIAIEDGVYLNTSIEIKNQLGFVYGALQTDKITTSEYIIFNEKSEHIGSNDICLIDGFVKLNGQKEFLFPVGDSKQLRPLLISSQRNQENATCMYHYKHSKDNPIILDYSKTEKNIVSVSEVECWHLSSKILSTISVSWNERNNLANLTSDLSKITLVGWNKERKEWIDLGFSSKNGTLTEGFISSSEFIPNEYESITFGVTATSKINLSSLDNYYISPNGDGLNDVLVFENIDSSSINFIQIYDRFGLQVFEANNYTNEFDGTSNINNNVIKRASGLPSGVYFYVIGLTDSKLNYQGFLYLNR